MLDGEPSQLLTELPLVLLLWRVLLIPLRPSPWSNVVAGIPLVTGYLLHDIYFYAYSSIPSLGDVSKGKGSTIAALLVPGTDLLRHNRQGTVCCWSD